MCQKYDQQDADREIVTSEKQDQELQRVYVLQEGGCCVGAETVPERVVGRTENDRTVSDTVRPSLQGVWSVCVFL